MHRSELPTHAPQTHTPTHTPTHTSTHIRTHIRSTRIRTRTYLSAGLALAGLIGAGVAAAPGATAALSTAQVTSAGQTIAGFAASGAWWVNDLAKFSSSAKAQAASLLFTSAGLDLSQFRYNIGGGGVGVSTPDRAAPGFLTSSGTYNWSADPGGVYFLQAAASDGVPDLIGFVNSAPEQYTSNSQNCAGTLVSGDESAYGTYLATVASHFKSLGITLGQISPMNEPDDSFSSCGQEGMAVPASERAGTVSAVGSALASAGLSTTVIADESSQTTQSVSEVPTWISNSTAAGYTSAIAHHTYNNPSSTQLELEGALGAFYNKAAWNSEICCQNSSGSWSQQYDPTITGGLTIATDVYKDLTFADDSAFQWWTALSNGLGCDPSTSSTCATSFNSSGWNDGLIYYDPNYASDGNQTLYITKRFYALAQFSRFVRPGAVRYNVTASPSGVETSAFWNSSARTWTVVAINTNSSSTSLSLNLGSGTLSSQSAYQTSSSQNLASVSGPSVSGSTITASLPGSSVTTYVLGSSGAPGSGGTTARELAGTQSGKCLDVPNSSFTNGTQVDIQNCTGSSQEEFTLTASGAVTAGGKCLDAYQQGKTAGTVVDVYTCNGGSNQRWALRPDGVLTNAASGLCLDVAGQKTAAGSPVDLWTCNGGTNQQWTLN